jgi:hypothetical protein
LELLKTGLVIHQYLVKTAEHNRVQQLQIPSHRGDEGNETADQLARFGSEHSFIGPKLACGISARVAKKVVRYWTETKKILITHNMTQTCKGFPTRTFCQNN